eukprot:g9202.t1
MTWRLVLEERLGVSSLQGQYQDSPARLKNLRPSMMRRDTDLQRGLRVLRDEEGRPRCLNLRPLLPGLPTALRDGILSLWYRELYSNLEQHPSRTNDPDLASVFFLGIDVSCAYLYPVMLGRRQVDDFAQLEGNYVREGRFGPLGDVQQCRQTRKARLDAYVRSGWAPYWGVEGKQHVVFDQLCHHPVMEVIQGSHFVSLAGVGHLKGRAYGYRTWAEVGLCRRGEGFQWSPS